MPCSRTGEGASSVCCSALLYVFGWFRRDLVFTVCHTSHQSDWSDVCLYLKTYKCIFKHGNRFTHSDSSMECTNTPTHTHTESVLSIKRPVDFSLFAISTRLIHNVWFIRLVSYASLKYCISHDGHFFCNPHLTRTQLEVQSALFIQNQARIDFFFFLFNLTVC